MMRERPDGYLEATTFEEHMDPSVSWVEDPKFSQAFDAWVEGETSPAGSPPSTPQEQTMAAHTNATDPVNGGPATYPSFVNIRFEGGHAIVTLRGEPTRDAQGKVTGEGATAQARFEQTDWDQFVAEATRERGLVPGG